MKFYCKPLSLIVFCWASPEKIYFFLQNQYDIYSHLSQYQYDLYSEQKYSPQVSDFTK